ncbi:hypothetical protein [Bdellovibrio sp.]|uniref:hypothetical protein n=1 Tax=Bdellovibrio sp. TaxID=28201 RepID=UPI003221DED2
MAKESYALRKPLTASEHKTLVRMLHDELKGRYHMRSGSGPTPAYYAAGWGEGGQQDSFHMHLTSKREKANFRFVVFRDKDGPRFKYMPDPNNQASLDVMERMALHAATHFFRKAKAPKHSGGRDQSLYDGFYMYRHVTPGNPDTKDLSVAISEGEMGSYFGETLKTLGIFVKDQRRSRKG